MDTDRTKGASVSKKRNLLLVGLTALVGFVATVTAKAAADRRKQLTESQNAQRPGEESQVGVAAAKKANQEPTVDQTTDEDQSDSAEDSATGGGSHPNHLNTPRPGAL